MKAAAPAPAAHWRVARTIATLAAGMLGLIDALFMFPQPRPLYHTVVIFGDDKCAARRTAAMQPAMHGGMGAANHAPTTRTKHRMALAICIPACNGPHGQHPWSARK